MGLLQLAGDDPDYQSSNCFFDVNYVCGSDHPHPLTPLKRTFYWLGN